MSMRDCIEELVRFVLHAHVNDSLGIPHLELSKHFCSTLLQDDPDDPCSDTPNSLEGVPQYPLYKRLAAALINCMGSEIFLRTWSNATLIEAKTLSSLKEKEWQQLILGKGNEIENILKSTVLQLHVQEPFFSQLKDGLKTIEGRCAVDKLNRLEPGNLTLFNKCMVFEIQGVKQYPSFLEMLQAESLGKVLPGVETVEEGIKIYQRFYTEEEEQLEGVLAISVSKAALQPYVTLAAILSGLNYEGVQGLLGLMHTPGTIIDALPPPRSALFSSFNMPFNPNVDGSTLSHGARALAKHIHRSSSRYWGSLDGSDANKNRLAMNIVSHLVAHSCWLNVHFVPLHGAVFEVRVADGYGARWSKDGSKFIGFLEPYIEDGPTKGWKH